MIEEVNLTDLKYDQEDFDNFVKEQISDVAHEVHHVKERLKTLHAEAAMLKSQIDIAVGYLFQLKMRTGQTIEIGSDVLSFEGTNDFSELQLDMYKEKLNLTEEMEIAERPPIERRVVHHKRRFNSDERKEKRERREQEKEITPEFFNQIVVKE